MPGERLSYLLVRYFGDTATDMEREELMTLLADAKNEPAVKSVMDELWSSSGESRPIFAPPTSSAILAGILKVRQISSKRRFLPGWRSVAAAAAILVLLGTGMYLWQTRLSKTSLAKNQPLPHPAAGDASPGGNKAILTLANGKTIVLDTAANGTLARQGNTRVQKLGDGRLAYNALHEKPVEIFYNTLATPRGGQYQLALPDGSKVWLNAASSVSYPTVFAGRERKVEIKGEAYFEIAKNEAMPFVVQVNDVQVLVLGTHFNINAYSDEASIKTTLLEGAVKVTKDAATALLKPGQQARTSHASSQIQVKEADTEAAVAWKNGYFSFNQTDLPTVMRQIARWYDVDIVYSGKVPDRRFGGEIPRNINAAQVLKMLEESKVHFTIEGKKIIVLP
jgi:ferric-dicitrate binding protein FerR (iron transport regulator)